MEEEFRKSFTPPDFVVFLSLLAIPSIIGVYFACKDKKNSSTSKYFFGEKKMHPIAVGISTAVTSISAVTMIAYPAEVYLVGTVFLWAPMAIVTAAAITMFYYVPFYGRLQLDTIYGVGDFNLFVGLINKMRRFYLRSRPGSNGILFLDSNGANAGSAVGCIVLYLELRFNSTSRRIVAAMVTVSEIFFMGSIIYLPATALNAVAPISINWSIVLIGGVCTFYTTLGGMQAVVWTDVVQSLFMVFASAMLFVRGVISVGGIGEISAALQRGNRTTFLNFNNYDISSRMHPLAISIGEFFVFTHYLGFSQPIYQRILSCKNTRQSQYSIVAYIIPALIIICLSISNGLLMYTYFEGCDPVESGKIESRDQGVPYMALIEFSDLPGMSGMFVAAVFSGTLSTISSGLNANSAVIVEDFISPLLPKLSEKTKLLLSKVSAFVLGVLVVSFAYVISTMGQGIFKIMRCFVGAIGGSVLGIYLLGIFIPWSNSAGAITGGTVAYAIMVWIFMGSNFLLTAPPRIQLPPISVADCPINNETLSWNATETAYTTTTAIKEISSSETEYTFDQLIYSLNFHYYVMTGCALTIIVGIIASFITGPDNPSDMDPAIFMPIFENHRLPEKVRRFFRCGVPTQKCDPELDEKVYEEELKSLNPTAC